MCITGLQVTQMLIGFWVTLYAAARLYDGPAAPGVLCQTAASNTVAGLFLYGAYFVLFFRLFVKSYLTTSQARQQHFTTATNGYTHRYKRSSHDADHCNGHLNGNRVKCN